MEESAVIGFGAAPKSVMRSAKVTSNAMMDTEAIEESEVMAVEQSQTMAGYEFSIVR